MQNPFTTTFSKAPEYTYISTSKTDEIIDNFRYDRPSESVYKITGVRGSGKTVILSKIESKIRNDEELSKQWIILDLSPARDMLNQMAAMLDREGFNKSKGKNIGLNVSATINGTGGAIGYSSDNNAIRDIGVEIDSMIQAVQKKNKKILIGIDEVSKTKEMIEFTSEFGRWLIAEYPVYLVCTGLYENIQELSNVKNLTFFRRATTVNTEPLNLVRMSEMYRKKLNIEVDEAQRLAKTTKGYAYGFQELGVLYFKKGPNDTMEDILADFKTELYTYAYEKIWEEMTEADRFLVRILAGKDEYKREEVLTLMGDKSGNYSVYRDRLQKRGIINTRQAYISLALPFFGEYVREYCES